MSDRSNGRLLIFAVLVVALMVALVGRVVQMTMFRGGELARAAESNDTRSIVTPAVRGRILDREGTPLAGIEDSLLVRIDPGQLPTDSRHREKVLESVADRLGMTKTDVQARMMPCGTVGASDPPVCSEGDPSEPAVVAVGVARVVAQPLVEMPERFPGVDVVARTQRSYPATGPRGSHALGYLGRVTADEMAEDGRLIATDLVGRSGLEAQYNSALAGEAGRRQVKVDTSGLAIDSEQVRAPVAGSTLITSLDAGLQAVVEESLSAQLRNRKLEGSAVVLDVKTGRVLAMASYPDYNPQVWTGGISEKKYQQLVESNALLNKTIQGAYAPGSTFKPVTVVGMESAGYGLRDSYRCPAKFLAAGQTFRNYASQAHGTMSLARALEISCNTVFYRVGDQLWKRGGAERSSDSEIDPIARAAVNLGLGSRTGIDLPDESAGSVASPAAKHALWEQFQDRWCAAAESGYPELAKTDRAKAKFFQELDRENCSNGNLWRQGDAINASIGQGITSVSPLQFAAAYAALAGDGRLRSPRIGRALVSPDGSVTDIAQGEAGPTVVNKKTRRFLANALARVTTNGTASKAFAGFPLHRFPVAGKTGSAQVVGKRDTSWFGSFAPADDPKYVVMVTVPEGDSGGGTSAPIARRIYEAIFGIGRDAVLPPGDPKFPIPNVDTVAGR